MKTLKRVLFFIAGIGLLMACSKSDNFWGDEPLGNTIKEKQIQPVTVTVPFKCNLTVWDHSDYTDMSCGEYPNFLLTMKGEGTISHLGSMTTVMTFCCNVETGVYGPTNVTFVAANGDELYADIPVGYILPNDGYNSDFYQSYFNDPIYIIGGTGRFEGASGEGMTNAFVHDPDPENTDDVWHTDFFSTGTLTLVKGNL
ncbi:MAG: hypothetical protein JXR67_03550 [Bacteroidales bacterium]|nr:hypothetical protein [Bacteroidales bacterium]